MLHVLDNISLKKIVIKRNMGYAKIYKRWIQKRSKIKKRKRKTDEKKIAHVLAKVFHERNIFQRA